MDASNVVPACPFKHLNFFLALGTAKWRHEYVTFLSTRAPRPPNFFGAPADHLPPSSSNRLKPLLDAARVLLARGCDPEQRLVMRHKGSSINAMSGKIGELAKWTVKETNTEGPHFVPYQPFDANAHLRLQGSPAHALDEKSRANARSLWEPKPALERKKSDAGHPAQALARVRPVAGDPARPGVRALAQLRELLCRCRHATEMAASGDPRRCQPPVRAGQCQMADRATEVSTEPDGGRATFDGWHGLMKPDGRRWTMTGGYGDGRPAQSARKCLRVNPQPAAVW